MLRARVAATQHQTVKFAEAAFRAALNEGLREMRTARWVGWRAKGESDWEVEQVVLPGGALCGHHWILAYSLLIGLRRRRAYP